MAKCQIALGAAYAARVVVGARLRVLVGARAGGVKMNRPVWSRWMRQPPSWTARW